MNIGIEEDLHEEATNKHIRERYKKREPLLALQSSESVNERAIRTENLIKMRSQLDQMEDRNQKRQYNPKYQAYEKQDFFK